MSYTYVKSSQNNYLSQTWKQALQKREMEKNNYHMTGNLKKAKAFVKMVGDFTFQTDFAKFGEQIIFSSDSLVIPLLPAFAPVAFTHQVCDSY